MKIIVTDTCLPVRTFRPVLLVLALFKEPTSHSTRTENFSSQDPSPSVLSECPAPTWPSIHACSC
ncbi:hypothetical protein C8R48DRAFT_683108 [Suillus tomentosus]|nr:hypothetical protein C8R48DRAFT_683108 [Suillus tomentosus]